MAEDLKSLEMRIAAIEDKLSKMNVTEEALPQVCVARSRLVFCWPGIRRPIITVCECQCGPCMEGGGGGFGGGFGGFGG